MGLSPSVAARDAADELSGRMHGVEEAHRKQAETLVLFGDSR
jgi:hypothetical protein